MHEPIFSLLLGQRKLAEGTKSGAVEVEQPDTSNTDDTQATKQAGASGNSQVSVKRMGKENATTGQGASEEVVGSEQAGSVLGVAERNVDKDTLHDDEDSCAVDGDADRGHDPVDALAGCPGEEEEADGRTKGGGKGRKQAILLDGETELDDARVHEVVDVGGVQRDTDQAGDHNAEEDETDLAQVHVVVDGVDEREDLEEGVVDAVDDGGVDLHKKHGGILDGDLDGLDEGVEEDGGHLLVALVNLALRHEVVVSGGLAEALGALHQESGSAGLGEDEKHDDEDGSRRPDGLEERPAPALDGDGETAKKRAESS